MRKELIEEKCNKAINAFYEHAEPGEELTQEEKEHALKYIKKNFLSRDDDDFKQRRFIAKVFAIIVGGTFGCVILIQILSVISIYLSQLPF